MLSLTDTLMSIGRLLLITFYGHDSSRVLQCLREHSSTTHESSPSVIRDASIVNLGTAPLPRTNIYIFIAVLLLVCRRRLDPSTIWICRSKGRE